MYRIIEHFALGRRRLELFGEDHNIRSGWLTVGNGLSSSNFNKEVCYYLKSMIDYSWGILLCILFYLLLNLRDNLDAICRMPDW